MPAKTLFGAGVAALLAGIILCSMLAPITNELEEAFPWNNWTPGLVASWLCFSLVGSGLFLILRGVFSLLSSWWGSGRNIRLFPGMILRNVFPLQRHRPLPLITQLPNFGLVCGSVIWVLIIIFMLFQKMPVFGLWIDFGTRGFGMGQKSPWQESLGVYLGVGEKYYVNGELVTREALGARLRVELSHHLDCTVYFEADADTLNMDAIYAMDTIQGVGGKLVWITPKMREELQRSGR